MIYRFVRKLKWVSSRRRLELYPPFLAMRIKVVKMEREGRDVVILLPLNTFNRNPGGGMFGGAMASLADPVAALLCARIFPGHSVWTRHMEIDFIREGRSDLQLRFVLDDQKEAEIREELNMRRRATPVFEYAYYDENDRLCARITNRVAIRPDGYRPSEGALGK